MGSAEDAASVLEQFVQEVANLPAEIAHLLEEIEAKDKVTQDCRNTIYTKDSSIQKFCKTNGTRQENSKEDLYCKITLTNFDTAQAIQEEKVALSDKARILLDRQIKRLDLQIRSLEVSGILPPDPLLPSLLHPSPGNRLPPLSSTNTGTSTPLNPIPGNVSAIPANPLGNTAIARLVAQQPSSTNGPRSPAHTGTITPIANVASNAANARSARESSLDAKRRRLTSQPNQSSSLRQSSLGPSSTPKVGAPAASRAGSAGPRASGNKKPGRGGALTPIIRVPSSLNPAAKKAGGRRKGRKGLHGLKPSPSDGDDSALSEVDGSENERASQAGPAGAGAKGHDGVDDVEMGGMEEEDDDGGDGDDKKYCTCHSVSYGNMVACDNEKCPYEWFHWSCVGINKEPAGKWYCDTCKVKMGMR